MEAFAIKQIEKKKKKEIQQKKLEKSLVLSKPEVDALNLHFGCPIPPTNVRAIGRNQSAAVWWKFDGDESSITGWEIRRYRKNIGRIANSRSNNNDYNKDGLIDDNNNNPLLGSDWSYKGSIFLGPQDHKQYVIEGLTNDNLYCFTMKAKNVKGYSSESSPSEEVFIEAPLPAGWFRFFDSNTNRFYYANIKSKQSSWERPEKDPYFLDESIMVNFSSIELRHLKELYVEEVINFKCIHIDRFNDVLRELGEKSMTIPDIQRLFKGFAGNEEKLESWIDYMNVMNYLKHEKIHPRSIVNVKPNININLGKQIYSAITGPSIVEKNFGAWIIDYSSLADRRFFRNTETGEIRWDMPAEIRFYIPPKMETQLLRVFDYLQIETLKKYFSTLDVDSSGELSDKELRLLLNALGAKIDDKLFNKLMKTADIDGNGTIEFSEFCWMIYQVTRSDINGKWSEFSKVFGPIKFFSRRGTNSSRSSFSILKGTNSVSSNKAAINIKGSNSVNSTRSSVVFKDVSEGMNNELIRAGAFTVDMFGTAINKISQELEIAMSNDGTTAIINEDSGISRRSSLQKRINEIKQEPNKETKFNIIKTIKSKGSQFYDLIHFLRTGKKRIKPEVNPHGLYCFCGCRRY